MLNAILHGKKRGTGLEGVRLKIGETPGAEDVLTATIFERLSYLPDTIIKEFFKELGCPEIERIKEIEFWPRWDFGGRSFEPDVVIKSDEFSLLVEAKRYDLLPMQYAEQLAYELSAGWVEGDQLTDKVILLTIGGMGDYSLDAQSALKEQIQCVANCYPKVRDGGFTLICCKWQDIYRSLEQTSALQSEPLKRLCCDIAKAFTWHDIRTHPPLWLSELQTSGISQSSFFCFSDFNPKNQFTPLATLTPIAIATTENSFTAWS